MDTQVNEEDEHLELIESFIKEVEKPLEQWGTQEDVDCPRCMHRYYLCVCVCVKESM